MKRALLRISLITFCLHHINGKILRNNALMSKMVSNFHKDTDLDLEPAQPKVLGMMQNVLCKNFPSVPCEMIIGDATLKKLIERSIQQLKYKKLTLEKTTPTPGYQLTLFPIVNSEDLSSYQAERNTTPEKDKWRRIPYFTTPKAWAEDEISRKYSKRTAMFKGRKNIRKFYPHKIKYKDKNLNMRKDFGDYSGDKLSMSVEVPDMTLTKKHEHFSYRREPDNPPVWRIDYTKHGEPTLNKFGDGPDQLKTKLIKAGPSVTVDENILEHSGRKDVMHPDVYIKKKKSRKRAMEINPEAMMD